jgi:hypothetical protein
MRSVDRSQVSVPTCLESADKLGKTERDRARDHQNDANPAKGSFAFAAYKHDEIKRKLSTLFHGKCAYCETFFSASAPVDIEHYRPKASVSEDPAHPGYWWLAMSWDNLLPSCIDCNRRRKQRVPSASTSLEELYANSGADGGGISSTHMGKQDSFPIRDNDKRLAAESYSYSNEEPLLLNPAQDDPREHLRFHIDRTSPLSLVLPGNAPGKTSEQGAVSIQTYGLNRLGLVQDRTRLLRRLEFLGDLTLELGEIIDDLETLPASTTPGTTLPRALKRLKLMQDRTLLEIGEMAKPDAPYSEMVRTWVEHFIAQLTA